MAWDDQGNGIPGHGLADVARRLAPSADLLGQRAVSGRAAPPDPAQGLVNPAEESILVAEVEPDLGKVRFLATEVPLRRRDDRRNVFRRRCRAPRRGRGGAIRRSAASALFVGNWKRATPSSLQAMAQKPIAVSKM